MSFMNLRQGSWAGVDAIGISGEVRLRKALVIQGLTVGLVFSSWIGSWVTCKAEGHTSLRRILNQESPAVHGDAAQSLPRPDTPRLTARSTREPCLLDSQQLLRILVAQFVRFCQLRCNLTQLLRQETSGWIKAETRRNFFRGP